MKPCAYLAVLSAVVLSSAPAAATPVSGDQSGTWTLAQSPYELVGDVRVPPGETLVIEPGVVVNAQGHYKILVDQATLHAVGTPEQPILMTAADHVTGWRGIRLEYADDRSIISHCIIEYAKPTGTWQEVRGGAIYCLECSPTISHNELRLNISHNANSNGCGAGVSVDHSSAVIVDNFIHDNTSDSGGGIACLDWGTPLVAGNVVIDNHAYYAGGGIYVGARSTAHFEHNVIMHNSSGGWGGGGINSWTSYIFYGTYCTIEDCIIAKNTTTTDGGGIYARYDRCQVTNCVIAENTARAGGGIYVLNQGNSPPIVYNTIIWDNDAYPGKSIYLYPDTGSTVSVSYSDVDGGWSGLGNINEDPLFVDAPNDDYHIATGSLCIDAGWPNYSPPIGATDMDGQMRVWDGDGDGIAIVDMGTDEFGSYVYGDLNCDGALDAFDIDPFVLALTDPDGYAQQFPECERMLADCNYDGQIDAFDIDPFVGLLVAG